MSDNDGPLQITFSKTKAFIIIINDDDDYIGPTTYTFTNYERRM